MKTGLFVIAAIFGICCYAADVAAGTEGHGGDLLRKLFADAKTSAAAKTRDIKSCSFAPSVPPHVREWILAHRHEFVSDILRSQHIWITDTQPTCAWTQLKDAHDITLSFEACRPLVKSQSDAAHILYHESVHHFGISDEGFAEAVANAMDTAVTDVSCPADLQDAFSPDACPGDPITPSEFLGFFKPGGDSVAVGQPSTVIYRSRRCLGKTEDLCTEWSYRSPMTDQCFLYGPRRKLAMFAIFSIKNGKMEALASAAPDIYGCNVAIHGIGTNQISVGPHGGPYGGHSTPFLRGTTGRLTKDCLVLKARENMENEAAVLIHFR